MKDYDTLLESMVLVKKLCVSKKLAGKKIEITYDDVQKAYSSLVEKTPLLKQVFEDNVTKCLLETIMMDIMIELFEES